MDGISDVMLWMKYSNTVEVIDEFVISNPGATVAELRVYAEAQEQAGRAEVEEAEARARRGVCKHCDTEIVQGNDEVWYHGSAPAWGSRGCRSYSFVA